MDENMGILPSSSTSPLFSQRIINPIEQRRRRSYTDYKEPYAQYRHLGKRMFLEIFDRKNLVDNGRILNLAAYDPQL